jgi:hypothetical protein
VLIKKKDVNDYFAARRSRHPLSPKQASAIAATRSSQVKRGSKTSSSPAANDVPVSPGPTEDSRVPPFTSERDFNEASPLVVNRWTKA